MTIFANPHDPTLLLRSQLRRRHDRFSLFLQLLKIFLKILSFLSLASLQHFFLLSFFNAFLIALHNDCHKNVLHSCIEQDHENYQIQLTRKTLSPGLKKCIVDDVTVEEREKSDD